MEASSDCAAVLVPEIQGQQLIIPESTDQLTLADFMPVLRQYKTLNASMVFDYRDKKGNKEARSHVAKLRKIKAPIAEIHQRLKAHHKAIVDQMDTDKREALSVVEDMIEFHDKSLREVADEEKAEAARKQIEVEIADCWDLAHDMNTLFDQQREVARKEAEQTRIAEEQAAKQREIDRLQREKEIAEKAAEDAKLKAEAEADRKIKEAEARAAREKAEAETRACKEEERKRQEEARAAADLENIKRVHRAILAVMVEQHGLDEDQAKDLIIAIREGRVPAVSIDYQWEASK